MSSHLVVEMDRITSSRIAGMLLICHSAELCTEVADALKGLGHECVLTSSPTAGLTMASLARWTIFMEANHPEMSGLEFADALRGTVSTIHPSALLLLTNGPDFALAVEGMRRGVDDILIAPISSADVSRSLQTLADKGGETDSESGVREARSVAGEETDKIRATLEATIASRSIRCQFFEEKNLIDPAWDMLLDLTRARLKGLRLSASAVCTGIPRSMATGLRVLRTLEAEGLVVRVNDPQDKRRSFVELSDAAFERMKQFLERISVLF